jgi:hypothetical protein
MANFSFYKEKLHLPALLRKALQAGKKIAT